MKNNYFTRGEWAMVLLIGIILVFMSVTMLRGTVHLALYVINNPPPTRAALVHAAEPVPPDYCLGFEVAE